MGQVRRQLHKEIRKERRGEKKRNPGPAWKKSPFRKAPALEPDGPEQEAFISASGGTQQVALKRQQQETHTAGGTGWLRSFYKPPTPPSSTQLRTIPLPRQLGCPTSNSEYSRCQAASLVLRDHLLVIQPDPSNRPSPLAAHTRM